ncbi:ubiquinol-cytochrome c reductase iron-sulfur subunit [Virgibacillus halodenitrificans]|jgi:menaquinol-cytochrome c reductase iron-sulfur subunit|uniref:Menaquinol:cytochrome c reductase iron-sulfur subunit n=1 Tax=Virgibacillus halodenitrificans TaxID=1482 RepID=A0AAC9NL59_VIRHA|nr:ubiquinol-cytochrome c reductase iron-sulfur subunit [Virgibacillus halodenitrificans]APC48444.1 menaquinol-cytochrome C reductase [Virgibacillus halodenitrificans]MBD1222601.1 ubiquinol-cytochrome c reductase iron-sulfur subunit [Virgibacillus halodenitrificans]MCG1028314.1 ubiquinol-cytochrome c reductase iron-sulfur subunit [Virgibacillus halodenitrificans]MCJ0931016.1 ubiquinol-cytochrome c reductase iron-sulfur subunit [Virgibacillus halodenitrificans]MEC2160403.1 ubiquinol-cytochrome 
MSEEKQQVSRRQFLNYTLTGVGGFMAAGMLAPMLRMAVDPVLKEEKHGGLINVGLAVEDITNEPQRVDWKIDQVDGWYESQVSRSAWVFKDDNGDIQAFSPICKHLGCVVSWEGSDQYPNQFYCPCHDGRYYKDGTNVPGTPPLAPLDVYEQEVKDGMLFLGEPQLREEA